MSGEDTRAERLAREDHRNELVLQHRFEATVRVRERIAERARFTAGMDPRVDPTGFCEGAWI